jgi:hypothetical protein
MGTVMNVKIELPQHYIETEGSLVQQSLRSLKGGDASAVFDEYGDIAMGSTISLVGEARAKSKR